MGPIGFIFGKKFTDRKTLLMRPIKRLKESSLESAISLLTRSGAVNFNLVRGVFLEWQANLFEEHGSF